MFGPTGPHAWKTEKGSAHLDQDMNEIATAQAKGEARAEIEKMKAVHGNHVETV